MAFFQFDLTFRKSSKDNFYKNPYKVLDLTFISSNKKEEDFYNRVVKPTYPLSPREKTFPSPFKFYSFYAAEYVNFIGMDTPPNKDDNSEISFKRIYGTVFDAKGKGLEGIRIELTKDLTEDRIVKYGFTDSLGFYEFILFDEEVVYVVRAGDDLHRWNKQVKYYTKPETVKNREFLKVKKESDGTYTFSREEQQ